MSTSEGEWQGVTPAEFEVRFSALEQTVDDLRKIVADLYLELGEISEQVGPRDRESHRPLTQKMIDRTVQMRREDRFENIENLMHNIEGRMQKIINQRRGK